MNGKKVGYCQGSKGPPTQFRVTMIPLRTGDDKRMIGRVIAPVPTMPMISRNDDGMLSVEGGAPLVVEIDGVRNTEPLPIQFSNGGLVRPFVNGAIPGPAAEQRFDRIVPVRKIEIKQFMADSFESGEGEVAHAFDNDPSTFWHTAYSNGKPKHPHSLTAFFASSQPVAGFEYTGRRSNSNGRVAKFEVHASTDGKSFNRIHSGTLRDTSDPQRMWFERPVAGVAIRFVALSEVNGNPWASGAELTLLATVD